jgi:hypothetical protein
MIVTDLAYINQYYQFIQFCQRRFELCKRTKKNYRANSENLEDSNGRAYAFRVYVSMHNLLPESLIPKSKQCKLPWLHS